MNERIVEMLRHLSGGKVTSLPNGGATYPGQSMGGEPPSPVDWHAVAARQTLAGTNTVSRTIRNTPWLAQDAPELHTNIAWDERSLNRKGIPTD